MTNIPSTLPWTLRAIARLERDTARPLRNPRLTEPGFATWKRTAGRRGWTALIELLHDDLAQAFPTAFDLSRREQDPLAGLDDAAAEQLLTEAVATGPADTQAFLRAAAQAMGLPDRGKVSEFPKVQSFQRVVELPGSGGRIAAQQVLTNPELGFDRQFLFVADSDAERVLIGIAALELRSNPPEVITTAQLAAVLSKDTRLDRGFGFSAWPGAQGAVAALEAAGKEVRCL
jgi:hypothetical protein